MNFQNFETAGADAQGATRPTAGSLRFSHTATFGEKVKWLPPSRLAPRLRVRTARALFIGGVRKSCWSAKRETHAAQATSFALVPAKPACASTRTGMRVSSADALQPGDRSCFQRGRRRGRHGARSRTHCVRASERARRVARLSASLDTVARPHPLAGGGAPFAEPKPRPPKASISTDPRVKAAADPQELNDYLDLRADWIARRFAWDAAQSTIHQLKERAPRAAISRRCAST